MTEKTCSKCGTLKPLSEFYDYREFGGVLVAQCRKCISESNAVGYQLRRLNNVKSKIAWIKRVDKAQRSNVIYRWVENGKINPTQHQTILREVEF